MIRMDAWRHRLGDPRGRVEAPVRWVKTHPMRARGDADSGSPACAANPAPPASDTPNPSQPIGWVLTHRNPPQASISKAQSPPNP